MDLLLTPADPAFPTEDTLYLAGDKRWECGRFRTYAGPDLRSTTQSLKALPDEELNGFLQTWLFFGLVAEFLGLNEQEDGEHIVDPSQAQSELDDLYNESIVVKEDGKNYITGAKVLALVPLIQERIRTAAGIAGGIEQRLMYLDHCVCHVHATAFLWNISERLDYSIKNSLAALGELFSITMMALRQGLHLQMRTEGMSIYWNRDCLVAGGRLKSQMLAHGWCYSEVEKMRKQFVNLNTMHYVSRTRKSGPRRDHSRCHKHRCLAFQIRMHEYQLAHVEQCRGCELLNVELDGVAAILEKTHSYPVLTGKTAWNEVYKRDEVRVEAFDPAIPYVAISHVWADGLGNPTANALPGCQVDRLTSLVAKLQNTVDPDWKERGRPSYRTWVDSLCCPVESNGKSIALGRMADVYRNAAHVLVLDSSLTSFPSEAVDPAELLFRALSCSAWMRRLWTFQEGALARSLFYQFADCAVTGRVLFNKVAKARHKDMRYYCLLMGYWRELIAFEKFAPFKGPGPLEQCIPSPIGQFHNRLWHLQHALNSRSVSVLGDEPLCIATVLGLDIGRVVAENGANATQKRMAIVWEMIARRLGGIPPDVIFFVDNPLDIVGFRWAPRSLLAADVQHDTDDLHAERESLPSTLVLVPLVSRFYCTYDTKLAQLTVEGSRKGLWVSYPGFKVYARPYPGVNTAPEQYRLQPWDVLMTQKFHCDWLLTKEEETGQWYAVLSSRSRTEVPSDTPFCKAVRTGHGAMILESAEPATKFPDDHHSPYGVMVLIQQEDDMELVVSRQFPIRLTKAVKEEIIFAETMTEVAEELASEQVTANFIAARDQVESDEYTLAKAELEKRMEELVVEARKARPDFANAVDVIACKGKQDRIWEYLAMFAHQTILERTPEDQVWLVD